jgi:hypothetical protein
MQLRPSWVSKIKWYTNYVGTNEEIGVKSSRPHMMLKCLFTITWGRILARQLMTFYKLLTIFSMRCSAWPQNPSSLYDYFAEKALPWVKMCHLSYQRWWSDAPYDGSNYRTAKSSKKSRMKYDKSPYCQRTIDHVIKTKHGMSATSATFPYVPSLISISSAVLVRAAAKVSYVFPTVRFKTVLPILHCKLHYHP